jgi:hypothetical protein
MSKVSNVHSGHYKTAGRGRQGEGLLQEQQKRAYVTQRESMRVAGNEEQAGIPTWEATPPNLETEAEPESSPKQLAKRVKKPAKRAKTAKRKPSKMRKAASGQRARGGRTTSRKRPAGRSAAKRTIRRRTT